LNFLLSPVDFIQQFGFPENNLPRSPSLALGSGAVTPLELNNGFAILDNGGFQVSPHFISLITDSYGEALYEAFSQIVCEDCLQAAPRILSGQVAYLINTAMRAAY